MAGKIAIEGNIKEYCIACLSKSQNMHNILEKNSAKGLLFFSLFNVELTNYMEYPQFLCYACDMKLNVMYDFQENVRKCLNVLKEFNENLKAFKIEDEQRRVVKSDNEEDFEENNKINEIKANIINGSETKVYQRIDTSKIVPVPSEEINQIIEEFKNRFLENKTCVLCGYFAANRRAISSHMALFHKDKKNIWCLECNDIFENYEEHKQTHSGKYECPFCKKHFNQYHYVEHLKSHAGTFECEFCKKTFKSAGWLRKHIRIHTNEKPYACPNCPKCFIQLSSLQYHIVTHGKLPCVSCKKRYKTKKELAEHECVSNNDLSNQIKSEEHADENVSEIEETITKKSEVSRSIDSQNFCMKCNKRVKSLNQHYKKYHMPKEPQDNSRVTKKACTLCQKTFSNAYNLRVHIRTHTGVMPYKCKYCDKRTTSRSQLIDHERTHTEEKPPYICNFCGKGLCQASALRTHMKQHTGKPEICALCDKRFCRKSELRLHLNKHMGMKPFLCPKCGKNFAQKSHLTEHMTGHSEERPFQCQYCEKAFKKKNLLREHMKLHKGFKPFKCHLCLYACYKAYRLQQHMKQHSDVDLDEQLTIENSNYDQDQL